MSIFTQLCLRLPRHRWRPGICSGRIHNLERTKSARLSQKLRAAVGSSQSGRRQGASDSGAHILPTNDHGQRLAAKHGAGEESHDGTLARTFKANSSSPATRLPASPPKLSTYVDGGMGALNNPSQEAYYELGAGTGRETLGTFVSVGTARSPGNRSERRTIPVLRQTAAIMSDPEPSHDFMVNHAKDKGRELVSVLPLQRGRPPSRRGL